MKKIVFFLMLAVALASCKGDEGPMGPSGNNGQNGKDGQNGQNGQDGKDGENGKDGIGGTNWYAQTFTIKSSDWVLEGGKNDPDSRYVAKKSIKELTQWVYDEGAVVSYIAFDKKRFGLPFVELRAVATDDGGLYEWTETTDAQIEVGAITFFVTYSDFLTEVSHPGDRTFHVVLMW